MEIYTKGFRSQNRAGGIAGRLKYYLRTHGKEIGIYNTSESRIELHEITDPGTGVNTPVGLQMLDDRLYVNTFGRDYLWEEWHSSARDIEVIAILPNTASEELRKKLKRKLGWWGLFSKQRKGSYSDEEISSWMTPEFRETAQV